MKGGYMPAGCSVVAAPAEEAPGPEQAIQGNDDRRR